MEQDHVSHPEASQQDGVAALHLKALTEALDAYDTLKAQEILAMLHVADIADCIDLATHEQRRHLVAILRPDFNPEILVNLGHDVKEEVIELLGPQDSAEAVSHLQLDDAVDVVEDLTEEERSGILEAMPDAEREKLEEGLSYPEDSAGRLLVKDVVTVPEFWTVGHIIDYLRSTPEVPQDFYQIFVVDPKFVPVGAITLSRIMCSERTTLVKDIMEEKLRPVRSNMDQEEVAYLFRQYGLVSTPVVNDEGRLIGAISVDDVVYIIEEEAAEDILHLGGVGETDVFSGFARTMTHRFPWLMINLATAILASIVIGQFEGAIEKLAALAVLMPIAASMGGNAGTQTLTVAVRAIATKELTRVNAARVIGKEVVVGVINGVVFGFIAGVVTYLWYGQLELSIIFAIATLVTLTLAGLVGALIPLGLVRIGVDPAIASSVVLTTVTDVVAFGAFLGLAVWWIL